MRLGLQSVCYNEQNVSGPLKTLAGGAPAPARLVPRQPHQDCIASPPGQVREGLTTLPGASPRQFQIKKSLKPQARFALKTLDSQGFLDFSLRVVKPETVQAPESGE